MKSLNWIGFIILLLNTASSAYSQEPDIRVRPSVLESISIAYDAGDLGQQIVDIERQMAALLCQEAVVRFDVFQEPAFALAAARFADKAISLGDRSDRIAALHAYALLRSGRPGEAAAACDKFASSQPIGQQSLVTALWAWSLYSVGTSVISHSVPGNGRVEVRPSGIEGIGPLTSDERREFVRLAREKIGGLISDEDSKVPADVYYIGALIFDKAYEMERTEGYAEIARLYFEKYLELCTPTHGNYLRRRYVQSRVDLNQSNEPSNEQKMLCLLDFCGGHNLRSVMIKFLALCQMTSGGRNVDIEVDFLSGRLSARLHAPDEKYGLDDFASALESQVKDGGDFGFGGLSDQMVALHIRAIGAGSDEEVGAQNVMWGSLRRKYQSLSVQPATEFQNRLDALVPVGAGETVSHAPDSDDIYRLMTVKRFVYTGEDVPVASVLGMIGLGSFDDCGWIARKIELTESHGVCDFEIEFVCPLLLNDDAVFDVIDGRKIGGSGQ